MLPCSGFHVPGVFLQEAEQSVEFEETVSDAAGV